MKTQALLTALILTSLPINAAITVTDPAFTNKASDRQRLNEPDTGGSLITHFTVGNSNLKVTGLGIFRSNPSDVNFNSSDYSSLTDGNDFGFTDANPLEFRLFKAATISLGGSGGTEIRAETSAGLITSTEFNATTAVSGVSGVNIDGAFIYQSSTIVLAANATYWIATSGWSAATVDNDAASNLFDTDAEFEFGRNRNDAPIQNASDEVNEALLKIGYSTYTGSSGAKGPLGVAGKEFWSEQDDNNGTRYTHASLVVETTTETATEPPSDVVAIPEPSSTILMILSSALLFRRQRR